MDIANPKLDSPELLYPNRKPVGNVKIDWENPLSNKLVSMFSGVGGVSSAIDLVDGARYPLVYGAINEPKFGELYYKLQSTNACIDLGRINKYQLGLDDITMFFKVVLPPTPATNSTYFFSKSRFAADLGRVAVYIPSGSQKFTLFLTTGVSGGGVSNTFETPDSLPRGVEITIAFTFSRTKSICLYVNGIKVSESATPAPVASQNYTTIFNAAIGLYQDVAGTGLKLDGSYGRYDMSTFLFYRRALSDVEIMSLQLNPYQFLIPA